MSEAILTNANIVLADEVVHGTVHLRDGLISDVGEGTVANGASIDFEGDYLIPGLVELHTDNLERHVQPRPKSFWPVKSAVINHDQEMASAGVTTVFDSLSVGNDSSGARADTLIGEMVDAIEQLAEDQQLKIDHRLHWRCEVSNAGLIDLLAPLAGHSKTGLFSVMDHTPGQRQFVSLEAFYTYYQGKFGLTDAQMETFIAERREQQQIHSARNRRTVVKMAKENNRPVASHDDATVEHVAEAIEDGIVVAEFPTTLEAARASHENGLAVLMGAPNVVRGKSHSGNISARELASQDLLDILSSDYLPYSLLYGAFMLERECENITLPKAIASVTRTPAHKVGLVDRGEVATGKMADLVRYQASENGPKIRGVWKRGERVA